MIKKYIKKPVIIEAIQLTKENFEEVETFIKESFLNRHYNNEVDYLKKINPIGIFIKTLEGNHLANIGDFIIKGVKGEFYPCKTDIFALTYEESKQ
jgi:hypothetical protein